MERGQRIQTDELIIQREKHDLTHPVPYSSIKQQAPLRKEITEKEQRESSDMAFIKVQQTFAETISL